MNLDWKDWVPYPYKNGKYACLSQPEYIRDRDKLFKGHNGWWWGDGWWSDIVPESPVEYHRRKRKERRNANK